MNNTSKLIALVKNARKEYANTVELLADEYVERSYAVLREFLEENPAKSGITYFSIPIKKVNFATRVMDIDEFVTWVYEPDFLIEKDFFRHPLEWDESEYKFCEASDTLYYSDIKPFIEALERRGFIVYIWPKNDGGDCLYPFLKVK